MSLTESPEFDIRYSTLDDMPFLHSWFKTSGMLHWFPPIDDLELENFIRVWMGFSRFNAALTAVHNQLPVAMAVLFLMPYRKVAHHCQFQIIVQPEYQRKAVGTSLMRNVKHLAKTQFRLESIHAEILDENPIISLLEKLDFTTLAKQARYSKENGFYYPRILMECVL